MVEKQGPENSEGSQIQANSGSTSVGSLNVGGNVGENVIVGNNNVFNYYATVQKNIEKHEPDFWALKHPYPMPPNFTGRIAERALLTHWLKEDSENRLFILSALGGFGKSALTWQWLTHDVDIKEYPEVVFWSFYEGDASFEHFIEETLKYLKLNVPQGQRPQVDELLKAMQSQKILLIMDGFERALRAYSNMNAAYQGDEPKIEDNQLDCVNINAEIFLKSVCSLPNIKSKVLMTTRLTPRAVKPRGEFMLGCREVELTAMQKEDAVVFFRRQGIKGTHAEIEAACAPYGYHPLSLRLLAGRILKDFKNPADIFVAQKIKIDGNIIQQKHHVLEVSYNGLPPNEQKLLSTIACFRSSIELKTLETVAENKNLLDNDLHDLVDRGLLHFDDKNKKFDLHPIVRRYAYERLTTPDRTATHAQLRDYFAAVDTPAEPQTLDELAPVIELYHHTVQAGELDKAFELYKDRLDQTLFFQLGGYQTVIELVLVLFPNGENKHPHLKNEINQASALNYLARAYAFSGQIRHAIPLYKQGISIQEKLEDTGKLATYLGNVAVHQLVIGNIEVAESNMRRRIKLSKETQDKQIEAVGHSQLGYLLTYRGAWKEGEEELNIALNMRNEFGLVSAHWIGLFYSLLAFRSLLMAYAEKITQKENITRIKDTINNAIKFMQEFSKTHFLMKRDYIHNHWLLGAVQRLDKELSLAEYHLNEALMQSRAINLVEFESSILLDLARLRYDQKNYEEAKNLADEALSITERCGYVLQGADVNLFLAQYSLEQEKDKARAKEYAETALKLATCDGPPYYYKVAYEEAERMLEKLK